MTDHIAETIRECEKLATSEKLDFSSHPTQEIDDGKKSEITNKIHSIIPQKRGAIVTSRGTPLPLSGRKKLNLGNTPILIVEDEERPTYVFPCRLGETYYDVNAGLAHLRANLPDLPPLSGMNEKDLSEIIVKNPEILENGLRGPRLEFDSGAGIIDIVLIDKNERHVLVEVEREADDAPLGQILRLCAAYEKKYSLPTGSVRGMIACMRAREFMQDAARRADIEIRIININEK